MSFRGLRSFLVNIIKQSSLCGPRKKADSSVVETFKESGCKTVIWALSIFEFSHRDCRTPNLKRYNYLCELTGK